MLTIRKIKNFFLYFCISLILFFPTYLFSERTSMGQQLLFGLFPAILFFFYLAILIAKRKFELKFHKSSFILLGIGAVIFTTILSKVHFLELNLIINHLRYFGYFIVFVLVYNIGLLLNIKLGDIKKAYYLISFLSLLFISLQLIYPSSGLVTIISKKPAIDYLGFRVGGPLEWSYIYSFVVIPLIFIALFDFQSRTIKYTHVILAFLILISVILTQSKAAYLSFFFSFFLYIAFTLKIKRELHRKLRGILMVLGIGLILLILYSGDNFLHIYNFLTYITGEGSDGSTATRLNQLQLLRLTLENNILLGYPVKSRVIENAYGHYLYYYGLVGLLSYLLLLIFFSYRIYRTINLRHYHKDLGIQIAVLIFAMSTFLLSVSSSPLDAHKSSYLFFMIVALYFAAMNSKFHSKQLIE